MAVTFLIFPLIALILLSRFSTQVYAQDPNLITEFTITGSDSGLNDITKGPDGNLWFTEMHTGKIGRITPEGTITEFPLLENDQPWAITSGSDGNLWFTDRINNTTSDNYIGQITPDGIVTKYPIPSGTRGTPYYITAGSDGALWFTEELANTIKRMTPDGNLANFFSAGFYPLGITSGPDHNIWFTEEYFGKLGRITPDGTLTEFTIPTSGSNPSGITSGPDGNIWFTEGGKYGVGGGNNIIGRITPGGTFTEYQIPVNGNVPVDIVAGSDGNLWFINEYNTIGRITPDGAVTEFSAPTSAPLTSIASGPDGNIWFTEMNSNKIGRVNLSLVPSLSDFKQTDPQWSTLPTQPVNVLTLLDHSTNCGDMYGYGCAVTATADVLSSYGKTVFSNSLTQLTPGTLNDWLSDAGHNGFDNSCSIIWSYPSTAISLGAPALIFRNGDASWAVGQQAIDDALNAGNIPIVGVHNGIFGLHFFALSHKLPDINGRPDYSIIDPALYPFISNNPGKTGKPLSQTYGGFDNVVETVIYKKDSSPQNTLTIRAHSPVQLLITDPFGNTTGYDGNTGAISEGISDSSYGTEQGITPLDGEATQTADTKYFQQLNPSDGKYILQVIGTGNGNYSLDISKTDLNGNITSQIINGVAKNGITETYDLQNVTDATQTPVIAKEITFIALKADLKKMYDQNYIDNKGVFVSLDAEVDLAIKANNSHTKIGTKLAITLLKTFLVELNAQRGKHVKDTAYQILNTDANSLIKSLGSSSGGGSSGGGS